jgi:hypothetical protein
VEVPLEAFYNNAWNPIVAEPVEHINFFTPEGVVRILCSAGFESDGAQVGWSSYEGRSLPVIRAVASSENTRPALVPPQGTTNDHRRRDHRFRLRRLLRRGLTLGPSSVGPGLVVRCDLRPKRARAYGLPHSSGGCPLLAPAV